MGTNVTACSLEDEGGLGALEGGGLGPVYARGKKEQGCWLRQWGRWVMKCTELGGGGHT